MSRVPSHSPNYWKRRRNRQKNWKQSSLNLSISSPLTTSDIVIDREPNSNPDTTNMSISIANNSSRSQQDRNSGISSMAWNTLGTTLCTANGENLVFWSTNLSSGVKEITEKQNAMGGHEIKELRYLDGHVLGGLSNRGARFWDSRINWFKIGQIKLDGQSDYTMFELNPTKNIATIASTHQISNYDLRKQCILLNTKSTITPIFSIKWSQYSNPILMAGGGIGNYGSLYTYNYQLQPIEQFVLYSSPIVMIDIDRIGEKLVTLGEEHVVQVMEFGDMLCQAVYQIPDQQEIVECKISWNGEYIAVSTTQRLLLLHTLQFNRLPIAPKTSRYLKMCWHPSVNLLAYVEEDSQLPVSVMKVEETGEKVVQPYTDY